MLNFLSKSLPKYGGIRYFKSYRIGYNTQIKSTILNRTKNNFTGYNIKRFFSKKKKNSNEEFEYTTAKENLYVPNNRIEFKNGLADIFVHNNMRSLRFFGGFLLTICGYIGFKCFKKVYNHKERSYFGLIWYTTWFIIAIRMSYKVMRLTCRILHRISLCQNGRQVELQTLNPLLMKSTRIVDIATIARPVNVYESTIGNFGFSIVINKRVYIIPREGERLSPELMPVILNGRYIDTEFD